MDDLISRQAAIDALKKISFSHWFECGEYLSEDTREIEIINSNKALEVIEALPPAQPKTGKWIIEDNPRNEWYRVTCSECGENVTSTAPCIGFPPDAEVTWDYCPYCGAKMDEAEP